MKAYWIYCNRCDDGNTQLIYAESLNKAKKIGLEEETTHDPGVYGWHDCSYIDMRGKRMPSMDDKYSLFGATGEYLVDWYKLSDREILAKNGLCSGDALNDEYEEWVHICSDCEIKNKCPEYKAEKEEDVQDD